MVHKVERQAVSECHIPNDMLPGARKPEWVAEQFEIWPSLKMLLRSDQNSAEWDKADLPPKFAIRFLPVHLATFNFLRQCEFEP